MNYIKQLQADNSQKDAKIAAYEEGLQNLIDYINSPKFAAEGDLQGYVNVSDIMTRIREIQTQVISAEN